VIARNQLVGLIAGVVLIIATITGALLVGAGVAGSSPETVVRSYLTAVYEAKNASQYLDLFDPQDLEALEIEYGIAMDEVRDGLQDSLDQFHSELTAQGMSVTWAVGNTTAQNRTAETTAILTLTHPVQGNTEDTEVVPTKERDGRWYLAPEVLEAFLQWFLWWQGAAVAP
jgi:hypothetical protein